MAFIFFANWHFFMMVMLIMLLSGVVCFFMPRVSFILILLASGLIGFVYSVIIFDVEDLAIFIVITNIVASLIPIIMIKYAIYLKRKAEEMEKLN